MRIPRIFNVNNSGRTPQERQVRYQLEIKELKRRRRFVKPLNIPPDFSNLFRKIGATKVFLDVTIEERDVFIAGRARVDGFVRSQGLITKALRQAFPDCETSFFEELRELYIYKNKNL